MQIRFNPRGKILSSAVCVILVLLAAAFFVVPEIKAQTAEDLLWDNQQNEIQSNLGLGAEDPRIIVANVIRVVLGFLGIIAVGLIMYGGFVWMTSNGSETKIDDAKKILKNAVIGLIIIMASFAIASFVLDRLYLASNGTGGGGGGGGGGAGGGFGASGNNIIESHYPARNQLNVPRNTSIIITFREAMNVGDLVSGGRMNASNIRIYRNADGSGGPFVTAVAGAVMPDNRTFRFRPDDYLGSPSEAMWYTVALSSSIRTGSGDLAFPGMSGTGYSWTFEVSTVVDTRPPKVESIIPYPDSIEPRNVIVQINFDEAIDPTSASGPTSGFNNIETRADGALVEGNYYISNQYQTVEFLTNDACGVNSCGRTIYCLPGNSTIDTLVKAATLVAVGDSVAIFPFDGIADMASNSLDGNKDNTAQGPQVQSGNLPFNENAPDPVNQGDDYTWTFSTNNNIDISAPVITAFSPGSGEVNVDLDASPRATFDKYLMSSSLTKNAPAGTGAVALYPGVGSADVFYWITKQDSMVARNTTAIIRHEYFPDGSTYVPEFNSNILDIYQNCYRPSGSSTCTPNPDGGQGYCCDDVVQANSCEP